MDFISCPRHTYEKIQFLYLSSENVDILCEDCLQSNIIPRELFKINKLISIKTLLQKPETIMLKLDLKGEILNSVENSLKYTSNLLDQQIRQMENQLQIIQGQIYNILEEFKSCIKNLLDLRKQFTDNVIQEFNFDSLKELLMELKFKDDDDTNPDAIEQLKQKLFQYFSYLQKDNSKTANEIIYNNIIQSLKNEDQEITKVQTLKQILLKLEMIQNNQIKNLSSIFPQIPLSTLFTSYQQYKIINLVKERQKCEIQNIQLIYLGSKDGLNAQSFWAKVNGKRNLLMIFKSKSNFIFGGYSPCQWQQNLGGYGQDNTNSSFLFSQTHDEIYPIVKNQYAIYCNSGYGPKFGGGYDICINADFQNGSSNLGYTYKWDKYQNKYSNHLFGQSTPHIIECEMFEILFK